MRAKEIAFVLLRIMALYVIIRGIGQFANLFQALYPYFIDQDSGQLLNWGLIVTAILASGIIYLLAGWWLWNRTGRLVRFFAVGKNEVPEQSRPASYREWYALGFTIVGIVLLVENIPNLFLYIAQLVQIAHSEIPSGFDMLRRQTWIALVAVLLKLAIALVLVLRAHGLYGLIRKIRELGTGDRRSEA
ncbi:hypothetical protein [Cohnella zeiphila]|uniref:Uncharacterized protein n=1 Tax=Cohnella zeiphila TaxID=2761120 RepID=A0A7X0SH52_9BACL|nr:hypothetical protein [Cohnella zeiphila]MBB6729871.1 hypothetical protein [Cohnella zeiphila]